ncbi:MAG: amidohydrolase family protein, partial [Bacteroidales bacterium]
MKLRKAFGIPAVLLILFLLQLSCKQAQLPSVSEIRSKTGTICIRNISLVDPVAEEVLTGMDILIRDGMIHSITPSGRDPEEDVDLEIPGENFYALPGFVNTHTHLWQHLSRSVSPSEQLQQWIPKVYRIASHLTAEEFFELNLSACYDALLHGITSVLDWTRNSDEDLFEQVLAAMVQSGLGGAVAWPHTAVFFPAEVQNMEFDRIRNYAIQNNRELFVAHLPPERIPIPTLYDGILLARNTGVPIAEHTMENVQCQRDWLTTVQNYLKDYGDSLQPGDKVFLEEIAGMPIPPSIDAVAAMSQNARIILDLINSLPEGEHQYDPKDISYLKDLASKTGPTYIPFLEHLGAYENGYVSIHSALMSPADIEIYRKYPVYINHNPESNAYLASGIAPIASYMLAGIPVTIGTDGAASNDRIDMLAAMRLMSHLQKVVALNIPLPEY